MTSAETVRTAKSAAQEFWITRAYFVAIAVNHIAMRGVYSWFIGHVVLWFAKVDRDKLLSNWHMVAALVIFVAPRLSLLLMHRNDRQVRRLIIEHPGIMAILLLPPDFTGITKRRHPLRIARRWHRQ